MTRPGWDGRDRRMGERDYEGPDRRQDRRVSEILDELTSVAHDLQTRSSTLVAMVDILQREVMHQDDEDASTEEKEATLDTIEAMDRGVVPDAATQELKKKLDEGDR